MGKPCVVGCDGIVFDASGQGARLADTPVDAGDWLSVDGDSGAIYLGRREVAVERPEDDLAEVRRWRTSAAPRSRAQGLELAEPAVPA